MQNDDSKNEQPLDPVTPRERHEANRALVKLWEERDAQGDSSENAAMA